MHVELSSNHGFFRMNIEAITVRCSKAKAPGDVTDIPKSLGTQEYPLSKVLEDLLHLFTHAPTYVLMSCGQVFEKGWTLRSAMRARSVWLTIW